MSAGTAALYRRFAEREAAGRSPAYEALALTVATDPELLLLVDALPAPRRQPNLVLAAAKYLGAPVGDPGAFRAWVTENWAAVRAEILTRATQTNEPGRCAALLPLLAALPGPLALVEVGASAGLCLYPDRYAYRYDDRAVLGDGPVVLECRTSGPVPLPVARPEVVWRAGADLNPLDVRDDADVRWLRALVWPGQDDRARRLAGAVDIARTDPPLLVRGDLNAHVADLVARAPAGSTPVVFHSAVLAYLPERDRETFARTMRELPCRWISNEAAPVLPDVARRLPPGADAGGPMRFVLALDGRPVALTGPHGQTLDWFIDEPVDGP